MNFSCLVGIKKLIQIVDLVRQCSDQDRIPLFLTRLEEEGGLEPTY